MPILFAFGNSTHLPGFQFTFYIELFMIPYVTVIFQFTHFWFALTKTIFHQFSIAMIVTTL